MTNQNGTSYPPLPADEVVALYILWAKYVLSESYWLKLFQDINASYTTTRFSPLVTSLLTKKYIDRVFDQYLIALGLPVTKPHYAASRLAGDLLFRSQLSAQLVEIGTAKGTVVQRPRSNVLKRVRRSE